MPWSIVLTLAAVLVGLGMTYQGLHTRLHPPVSGQEKRKVKLQFGVLAVVLSVIAIAQGAIGYVSKTRTDALLNQLNTKQDELKALTMKLAERPVQATVVLPLPTPTSTPTEYRLNLKQHTIPAEKKGPAGQERWCVAGSVDVASLSRNFVVTLETNAPISDWESDASEASIAGPPVPPNGIRHQYPQSITNGGATVISFLMGDGVGKPGATMKFRLCSDDQIRIVGHSVKAP
ncbi:MAG: hypothetical protein ABI565_06140 [Vicinamibacteria bacterium]